MVMALDIGALVAGVLVVVPYLTREGFDRRASGAAKSPLVLSARFVSARDASWLVSGRGDLNHDAVVFALKDRMDLGIVIAPSVVLAIAPLGVAR
jgi:hypothetical protein